MAQSEFSTRALVLDGGEVSMVTAALTFYNGGRICAYQLLGDVQHDLHLTAEASERLCSWAASGQNLLLIANRRGHFTGVTRRAGATVDHALDRPFSAAVAAFDSGESGTVTLLLDDGRQLTVPNPAEYEALDEVVVIDSAEAPARAAG